MLKTTFQRHKDSLPLLATFLSQMNNLMTEGVNAAASVSGWEVNHLTGQQQTFLIFVALVLVFALAIILLA